MDKDKGKVDKDKMDKDKVDMDKDKVDKDRVEFLVPEFLEFLEAAPGSDMPSALGLVFNVFASLFLALL